MCFLKKRRVNAVFWLALIRRGDFFADRYRLDDALVIADDTEDLVLAVGERDGKPVHKDSVQRLTMYPHDGTFLSTKFNCKTKIRRYR